MVEHAIFLDPLLEVQDRSVGTSDHIKESPNSVALYIQQGFVVHEHIEALPFDFRMISSASFVPAKRVPHRGLMG